MSSKFCASRANALNSSTKPLVLPLEECLQQLGPVGEIVVDQGRRNRRGFGKAFHGKRLQTLADQQGLGRVQQLLTASIG